MLDVHDARQPRRLMAVWLMVQGQSPGEIAGFLGCSYRSVNKCQARYLERRCSQDLAEQPRAGRLRANIDSIFILKGKRRRQCVLHSDAVLATGGKLDLCEAIRCRVRYSCDDVVLGSRAFANGFFIVNRKGKLCLNRLDSVPIDFLVLPRPVRSRCSTFEQP